MTTTHTPRRIQRKRTRNWLTPLDAQGRRPVYVGRPTRWANPWTVAEEQGGWTVTWTAVGGTPAAVDLYRESLAVNPDLARRAWQLAGRNLMCWCALELPCHADVLLAATPGPDNGGVE